MRKNDDRNGSGFGKTTTIVDGYAGRGAGYEGGSGGKGMGRGRQLLTTGDPCDEICVDQLVKEKGTKQNLQSLMSFAVWLYDNVYP